MNPIYEKLYEPYGQTILDNAGNFDHKAIQNLLNQFSLDPRTRTALGNAFFDFYLQWSDDAFSAGLHLGLSLCHDEIRRFRA